MGLRLYRSRPAPLGHSVLVAQDGTGNRLRGSRLAQDRRVQLAQQPRFLLARAKAVVVYAGPVIVGGEGVHWPR